MMMMTKENTLQPVKAGKCKKKCTTDFNSKPITLSNISNKIKGYKESIIQYRTAVESRRTN